MKTIGNSTYIMSPEFIWDEIDYNSNRIGYAENWAIKVADELAKKGNNVYVFGNPKESHVSESGVKYFKLEYLFEHVTALEFDTFITSRFIFDQLKFVNALKKILIVQEDEIIGCNTLDDIVSSGVKSVGYISEYQKALICNKYVIPENMMFKTSYGFDIDCYNKYSFVKENRMVFSGDKKDGIYLFADKIFPKIKKEVPDFELYIIKTYEDYNELVFKQDGIKIIENVPYEEKVKLQCSSKIWSYVNNGYNSYFDKNNNVYCFGAIENALAKNACIISAWGPCFDILDNYEGFVCNELINNYVDAIDYDNFDKFVKEVTKESIKCLKDEEYRKKLAEEAYNDALIYTWENVCKSIEYESNRENQYEKDSKTRVMLCCIGRLENEYIREFGRHY